MYSLPDSYFYDLRALAERYNIRIKSVFTAHRELGGFFSGDARLSAVARENYERLIEVAALLGAEYAGSNPGAVYRDRMKSKERGIACYLSNMKELTHKAKELGLIGLSIEPMSCSAEPPATPAEIDAMMEELTDYHSCHLDSTVPVYLCGDVSHGVADRDFHILYSNMELFEWEIPWMCEFHIKNTDSHFSSTFGFSPSERERGIVDVPSVLSTIYRRAGDWPVEEVVGYLEIGGPKLGRDYSDHLLGQQLTESLEYISSFTKVVSL